MSKPSNICPDCGMKLSIADAMTDHRGDALCIAEQARNVNMADLRDGWRRAGTTWATLEKAGVPVKFLPFGFTDNRPHTKETEAHYVRCAPSWAVWVSELTGFTPKRRADILRHCIKYARAREAVQTAARLGVVTKMRRGTARGAASRKAAHDFFTDLMTITDDVDNTREPVGST